ncbi:unnamed protein product [Rangifer tarandus platyrhynchus]
MERRKAGGPSPHTGQQELPAPRPRRGQPSAAPTQRRKPPARPARLLRAEGFARESVVDSRVGGRRSRSEGVQFAPDSQGSGARRGPGNRHQRSFRRFAEVGSWPLRGQDGATLEGGTPSTGSEGSRLRWAERRRSGLGAPDGARASRGGSQAPGIRPPRLPVRGPRSRRRPGPAPRG